MTIAAQFVSAARDYPARTFLRWCRGDERITWTYAEAALRVDPLAARLDALGIAAGDHVVVYTAEMVPSIAFDLACACRGVVFTPIDGVQLPLDDEDAFPEPIEVPPGPPRAGTS